MRPTAVRRQEFVRFASRDSAMRLQRQDSPAYLLVWRSAVHPQAARTLVLESNPIRLDRIPAVRPLAVFPFSSFTDFGYKVAKKLSRLVSFPNKPGTVGVRWPSRQTSLCRRCKSMINFHYALIAHSMRAVRHIHAVTPHASVVVEAVMHPPTIIRRQHVLDGVSDSLWQEPRFEQQIV